VHVAESPHEAAGGAELVDAVRTAAEQRGVACIAECRIGERVSDTLTAAAVDHGVDLVIMGEPVRRGLDPRRRGGITGRVLQALDLPVLVYPVDPRNLG
jgi:nucleotide-binding universal stress UspA family protein